MHAALRPGGVFLLEPQPWSSYRKNAGLAPHLLRNYGAIQIKPPQFRELLLGEIGFARCEELSTAAAVPPASAAAPAAAPAVGAHGARGPGFAQGARGGAKRPLLLFRKGGV